MANTTHHLRGKYLLFFPFLLGFVLSAQSPALFVHAYRADKLSEYDHFFLHRDHKGFLWTNVEGALCRFDGKEMRKYPLIKDANALDIMSTFHETEQGDLWFSATNCIKKYHFQQDKIVDVEDFGEIGQHLKILHLSAEGALWVVVEESKKEVYRINTQTKAREGMGEVKGQFFAVQTDLNSQTPESIFTWFDASQKEKGICIFRVDKKTGKIVENCELFTGNSAAVVKKPVLNINSVMVESKHLVWIAAAEGLYAFDPYHPENIVCRAPNIQDIKGIVRRKNGDYWFASGSKGIFCMPAGTSVPIAVKANLSDFAPANIRTLYLDHEEVLWMDFERQGIGYVALPWANTLTLDLSEHLSDYKNKNMTITSLTEDADGIILVGTDQGRIIGWNPNKGQIWSQKLIKNGAINQTRVFNLFKDSRNYTWAVTQSGLYLKKPGEPAFTDVLLHELHATEYPILYQLIENQQGQLLAAGRNNLYKIRYDPQLHWVAEPLLPEDKSKDYFFTNGFVSRDGSILLNNDYEHIMKIKPDFSGSEKVKVASASAFCDDPLVDSIVWVNSSSGPLFFSKTTNRISKHGNLHNDLKGIELTNLFSSKDGALWMSSKSMLFRYDPKSSQLITFSAENGLIGDAFVNNTMLMTQKGQMVLASSQSLHIVMPSAVNTNRIVPGDVRLMGLKVNDEPFEISENIDGLTELTFSHTQNTLSFSFAGLDYFKPNAVCLHYRLDGQDNSGAWVKLPAAAPGFARYANLGPGEYVLRLLSVHSDGATQKVPRTLKINILPAFYQTTWFLVTVIAFIFLMVAWIVRRMIRAERFKRHAAEMETLALRLQMNPHLLSNFFAGVNNFIRQNDIKKVSEYLHEFSRFMDNTLFSSNQYTISLEKEMEIIEQFLNLEKRRLQDAFNYELEVDDDIETFAIEIPGMLLQPFAENAIIHGIEPKKTPGLLRIHLSSDDNGLVCTIQDDGVGRNFHAPTARKKSRKSMSEKITRNRLELYDRINSTHSSFEIEDLKDVATGQPLGTKVTLNIGLKPIPAFTGTYLENRIYKKLEQWNEWILKRGPGK